MAVINTGMSKADMKKMLARAKEDPVSCAVGQGDNAAVGLLVMHRTKSPKAMEAQLKDEFPDVRNPRFGTAFITVDENPKLVKFKLNRAVSGLARRLIKTLKGTGYNKVMIVTEDGALVEDFEEEDEEAVLDDDAAIAAPAAEGVAPPESGLPAPPPPPPASKTPEEIAAQTAALQKLLATLASQIPAAAGNDAERKAVLMKFATTANVNLKTGNLVYAGSALNQLKLALDAAPAATSGEPISAQTLAKSRLDWVGVQDKVKGEVDKLRTELAKTYEGQPFASEINAAFLAKVAPVTAQFDDRLLGVLDKLADTVAAEERTALVGQARGLIKGYLGFAMSDPFITELDANPFVKLAIRPTVTSTLASLAKSIN